ncbi:endonuclease/exonuclease/phosphatase family protein [Streptomyces sp. 5-8]|uniref:Endonuclease/exonuclease/phosphatase family protein n=1 Tax=Streptomyces musisoli TaxID=2802280 RepID=A0ABS1PB57_9ACTN|nr:MULTISPECIES: endonuclease/exonuclease/phosphatase family protein [Streptomyces]MBL1109622.1 endonuclease/exonuclease/phosphatase family protein [Streptomyces musisoli]MBY8842219.1 endonuclease/exonuclease/phosphatase family protein [Streptomyces sp. SP2-10]
MNRHRGRRLGAWCAGLLLAGVSVVVGCRAADTDGITPVPQFLAFLPWLLAPAGFALLCALLARWWPGVVWAVAVLGLLAWYLEPYGGTGEPDGPPLAALRVLTSNVEFGRGTPALLRVVRDRHPDVVFVQECEPGCRALLEREAADAYPYRRAVTADGSKGSLILSRFPLTPAAGVAGTMGMPGAVADVRGHPVRLQLAHPMPPLPDQVGLWRRELGRLRAFAAAGPDTPTVLAGDFNASQDHAAFRHILDTGLSDAARLAGHDRTPSWPARTASVTGAQIDHVLVSPDFTVTGARFLRLSGTDHRALLTDLMLHGRK